MRRLLLIFALLVLAKAAKIADIDLNKHREGREDWKHPNDFLENSRKGVSELEKERIAAEGRLRSMDSMTKLMIHRIFEKLGIDLKLVQDVQKKALVAVSAESLATLRSYLKSNTSHNQMTQREQIHTILEEMFVIAIEEPVAACSTFDVAYDLQNLYRHPVAIPLLVLFTLSVVIYIQRRLTLRMFLFGVFLFCFIISCVLNFIRKHQEIVSEQMLRMHESSLSDACKPAGFFGDLLSLAKGLVMLKTKSECQKFHEDMFVSPLSQINPMEIMSEVLASFFAAPLTVFARHFNKFFNEYYADTPLHIFVIKTVALVLIMVIGFFAVSGYRLRTLFATLEPGTVPIIQQISNVLSEPTVPETQAIQLATKGKKAPKALKKPKIEAIAAAPSKKPLVESSGDEEEPEKVDSGSESESNPPRRSPKKRKQTSPKSEACDN
ncbi:hypothetical protein L596_029936 [Steinernema carpocapsae]|uniref:Chloride channel CLIC-like protein 1 n=1 Tax=Steinernema carpocapsae TaxID=34508 RepID=A0A4U5LR96_STECR|nr:hypothetical protein L596_029936 [Steinernema carpocapsae]